MSQNLLLNLAVLLFSLSCTASNECFAQDKTSKQDESKEPPIKYTLIMGDKSVTVAEGETLRVEGTFTNPELQLTANPNRVFPYQGISFEYPRAFNFEADLSDVEYKNWTLSGNDLTIMYFVLGSAGTTREFADVMVSQFGRENCKIADATPMMFGGKKLPGTALKVDIVGTKMAIDVYLLPSTKTQTKLLVLQDALDDDGKRSSEWKSTIKLITESSKVGK